MSTEDELRNRIRQLRTKLRILVNRRAQETKARISQKAKARTETVSAILISVLRDGKTMKETGIEHGVSPSAIREAIVRHVRKLPPPPGFVATRLWPGGHPISKPYGVEEYRLWHDYYCAKQKNQSR